MAGLTRQRTSPSGGLSDGSPSVSSSSTGSAPVSLVGSASWSSPSFMPSHRAVAPSGPSVETAYAQRRRSVPTNGTNERLVSCWSAEWGNRSPKGARRGRPLWRVQPGTKLKLAKTGGPGLRLHRSSREG